MGRLFQVISQRIYSEIYLTGHPLKTRLEMVHKQVTQPMQIAIQMECLTAGKFGMQDGIIGLPRSLDPLNPDDRWDDSDADGMSNWEEYNSIDPKLSETNAIACPQWYITTVGSGFTFQQWPGITNSESFGSFVPQDIINISGWTTDPTNPDTDGDGFLDGLELMFTAWNDSAQTWTLNPMVPGDGSFDADNDGLTDAQEFSLATTNPVNGENHPLDAPLMHIDGDLNDPTQKAQRVY